MATTTNVSSNYAGKEAGVIIGKAFKEADTLSRGLVSVYQNVNYKLNMRLINYADGTKAYACIADGGFTTAASGTVTLSEKVLEPVKLMLPLQFCKETFRQTWSEDLIGDSASNPNMPSDILQAIQLEVLKSTAVRTDRIIWQGDNDSNPNEWDGFIKLFEADASVIKANNGITPLEAAITEANVEAELKKFLNAIPTNLRNKDLVTAVSANVFQAYQFYLISKGIANDGNTDTKRIGFGKYQLELIGGLPDNTFVAYEKANLAFGTGLLADHNELSFVDEDSIGLITGQIRGKMVYNGGVQYANSDEVVYYLSTTVAD